MGTKATKTGPRTPNSSKTLVALGIGSNLGESRRLLHRAVAALARYVEGLVVAPLYRSRPVSPVPQLDYFNSVLAGRTLLSAEDLLAVAKRLEHDAGRRRGPRWGPRLLDVDLLVWGDRLATGPELTLPHPRLRDRRFVLAPLADLLPELAIPPDGKTARELLAALSLVASPPTDLEIAAPCSWAS